MESAFYINGFAIMFILLFGIMAIFFLAIGLKGILTKQPFLVSNRWLLSMMFVIFIPTILLHVLLLFISNFNWINGLNIFLVWVYSSDDVVSTKGLRCIRRHRHIVP